MCIIIILLLAIRMQVMYVYVWVLVSHFFVFVLTFHRLIVLFMRRKIFSVLICSVYFITQFYILCCSDKTCIVLFIYVFKNSLLGRRRQALYDNYHNRVNLYLDALLLNEPLSSAIFEFYSD